MFFNRFFMPMIAICLLGLLVSFCSGDDDDDDNDDNDSATDDDDDAVDDDDDNTGNVHPEKGQMVFTEVMYDPLAVDDDLGEWVEILNLTDVEFDLTGCFFGDDDHQTEILESVMVPANGYVIFAIGETPGQDVGGSAPDWTWGTYNLGNGGDAISLFCDEEEIDGFAYDELEMPFEPIKGASLALCPGKEGTIKNDDIANWKFSVTAMANGDFGTPRNVNDPCDK